VDPGPVWTDAGNLAPTGIRSPDRHALSDSVVNKVTLSIVFTTKLYQLHVHIDIIISRNVIHTFLA
jgi:hypothetical protein